MLEFELIKNIDLKNPKTWQEKVFLTFDLDWCSDEVLELTLSILEKFNVKATFLVTHYTRLLEQIKKNPNYDLGIHPNFDFLLSGDFRYGKNIDEVIDYYLDIIPGAKIVRSHSLAVSSKIRFKFLEKGIKYDLNTFVPAESGNKNLSPFLFGNIDLVILPFFWEDDFYLISSCKFSINQYIKIPGLKIFNFHPIHVFLNSENLIKYRKVKNLLNSYNSLKEEINKKNYGIRNFLEDLIKNVICY